MGYGSYQFPKRAKSEGKILSRTEIAMLIGISKVNVCRVIMG